jgi:hypothetical protein
MAQEQCSGRSWCRPHLRMAQRAGARVSSRAGGLAAARMLTDKVAAGVAAVEMARGRGGFVADEAAHLARRVGGATRRKRARRAVREALLEGGRLEPAARKVGGTRHAGADLIEHGRECAHGPGQEAQGEHHMQQVRACRQERVGKWIKKAPSAKL